MIDGNFWQGRRVFLTGHTGFKGSWLSLWLQRLGSQVFGYALAPATTPSLFEVANVADGMTSLIGDVRDFSNVSDAISNFRPEIVIHMAAQPIVRHSYNDPIGTYSTNVMGTVNVLEAARHTSDLKAIVNVTTDKCYENREWIWPYRERDTLGGRDPYSSSKACAELVSNAYRSSFLDSRGIALATVRAGNVIGGGDWSIDRLIPDLLRSFESGASAVVRNPKSTRPWQHVLEPLGGYLLLAERLHQGCEGSAQAWNFGPADADVKPVEWIANHLARTWGDDAEWHHDGRLGQPHEAGRLALDITKASAQLGWRPKWPLEMALENIVDWHKGWLKGGDAKTLCLDQIEAYAETPL